MSERTRSGQTKFFLYLIGALVLLLIVMYIWKGVAVRRVAKQVDAERQELAAHQEKLEEQMRQATAERVEELLQLTALPLGWAVRTEAIADDFDQIEEYAVRLVKEPRVRSVVLANPEGTIRLSTDRKLQGEPASRFFGKLVEENEITLEKTESGDYRLMVPILDYTGRLGSLVVTFAGD